MQMQNVRTEVSRVLVLVQGINQVLITSYVRTKITRVFVLVEGINQVLNTSCKNQNHKSSCFGAQINQVLIASCKNQNHKSSCFSLSGLSFFVTAAFSLLVSEGEEASFGF
jgi:hypothetical protein